MKYFKLDACFQYVLTGDQVSHSKPNPEIFLKTAQALLTQPEQCVVLEDSVFGVQAAKTGRMDCIAVTTGVYAAEELSQKQADLIVGSLSDGQVLKFILR